MPLRRIRRVIAVTATSIVATALLSPTVSLAQTSGSSLNPNQQSMLDAIGPAPTALCPQLRTANTDQDPTNDLDPTQTALLARCGRVLRATVPDEKANALQEITAEELNAPTSNAIDFNRTQRSQIAARLNVLRGAGGPGHIAYLDGNGGFSFDTTGGASGEGISEGRLGLFVNGKYGSGSKDQTEFEAPYDFDVTGGTVGVDYRFADHLVAGVAVGYASSSTDFDTGGSLDSDEWSGSIFGSWYGGNAYVDLIFTYGSLSLDSDRHVVYTLQSTASPTDPTPVTDVIDTTAEGDTDGDSTSLGLSAGYNFGKGSWQIGPTAAVSYIKVNIDGFSESGGDHPELNLAFEDQEAESLQLQLGLNVSYAASTSWGVLTPYARASYIWEQKDDQEAFFIRYVADPYACRDTPSCFGGPTTASVTSDKPDTSYVLWAVGVSGAFANGFSAFVDYESVASLDTISYGEATIGLRYQFR